MCQVVPWTATSQHQTRLNVRHGRCHVTAGRTCSITCSTTDTRSRVGVLPSMWITGQPLCMSIATHGRWDPLFPVGSQSALPRAAAIGSAFIKWGTSQEQQQCGQGFGGSMCRMEPRAATSQRQTLLNDVLLLSTWEVTRRGRCHVPAGRTCSITCSTTDTRLRRKAICSMQPPVTRNHRVSSSEDLDRRLLVAGPRNHPFKL